MQKKIIIVCYPVYGGSGIVATELGKALADRDFKVHFISYEMPIRLPDYHPNISFHEVETVEYPLFKFPMYEGALASTVIDVAINQNINLIHAHYAIPHAYMSLLAKQAIERETHQKIKVVTTLHGTDITLVGKDKAYKPLVEYAINSCDKVSCVSNYLKEETHRHLKIDREIDVIYNFIDTSRYPARAPKDASLYNRIASKEGDFIITHISNFRKVKRITDVVLIFKEITLHQKNATLLMVGDGPERYEAEKMCRELSICDRVKFFGKAPNVEKILNITDVFLLPSENESFGLVALEALASGVPVVATHAGGIPEVVIDGECGFLHPIGDVQAMAQSVIKLLSDADLKERFSQKAFEQSRKFEMSKIMDMYENLYDS